MSTAGSVDVSGSQLTSEQPSVPKVAEQQQEAATGQESFGTLKVSISRTKRCHPQRRFPPKVRSR